jgi:hypothetical protein
LLGDRRIRILVLMGPDLGGSKTYGSGSATLVSRQQLRGSGFIEGYLDRTIKDLKATFRNLQLSGE